MEIEGFIRPQARVLPRSALVQSGQPPSISSPDSELKEGPTFANLTALAGALGESFLVSTHSYTVYLCNRSNWIVTDIKDESGRYAGLPTSIGRTNIESPSPEDDTLTTLAPLLTISGNWNPLTIALHLAHPSGLIRDTNYVQIQPQSKYRGEILYLDIPDPV